MIWALAITAAIMIFSGDSPFIVKDLDKYVKTHVVDETKRDKIIVLLKDAQSKRKEVSKKDAKFLKELDKMLQSRDTKEISFDDFLKKVLDAQTESQKTNIAVLKKVQGDITPEEWTAIQKDIEKSLIKSDKDRKKHIEKAEKYYDKWTQKISKTIADKEKNKLVIDLIAKNKEVYMNSYKKVQAELMNPKSVMYKYKATEEEYIQLRENIIKLITDVYESSVSTHLELVKLTTEEEWKKIL